MNRKRILHVVGVVVLLAVVIPFVIYAVPGVVGANESYVILSGSMEPEMSPGDAVIVDDQGAGSIEEGDVITFSREGSDTVVTHRVVDVREENGERVFETKGDANDQADRQPVPADDVVGSVVLTIPFIGYVVHFVNTPLGFATTVILPIGLFVLSEVWTFARGSIESGDGTDDPADGSGTDAPGAPVGGQGSARGHEEVADGGPTGVATGPAPMADESDNAREETAERGGSEVTIAATDLAATTVLLVLATPYAAYVALQLQTLVTIAIAYTVGFSAFALGALQVAAMIQKRGPEDGQDGVEAVAPGTDAPDHSRGDGEPDAAAGKQEDVESERVQPDSDGRPETNGDDRTVGTDDGLPDGLDEDGADVGEAKGTSAVSDSPEVEWGDLDRSQFEEGESQ
jgi:signal peptidase